MLNKANYLLTIMWDPSRLRRLCWGFSTKLLLFAVSPLSTSWFLQNQEVGPTSWFWQNQEVGLVVSGTPPGSG